MTKQLEIGFSHLQEVAMRLKTSVQNKGRVFYTDVNGYQLVRRRTVDKLPLQGNFYPMPTSAVLQDKNTRLSLLSGQPLGVGALQEGRRDNVCNADTCKFGQ